MEALELLERALEVEYRFILYYPRLSRIMPTPELGEKVRQLGESSRWHAEVTSTAISRLGGAVGVPTIESLPENGDLKELFTRQLEFEKLALWLHSRASELVPQDLKPFFITIVEQERQHSRLTEEILAAL